MIKEIFVNIETNYCTTTLRTDENGVLTQTYVNKNNLKEMKSCETKYGSKILAVMYIIEIIKLYLKKG